jgi:two-component system, NarL family, response regulator DevR
MKVDASPAEFPGGSRDIPLAVRVFILEGHDLVRTGLCEYLERDGFDVVGSAASAADAVSQMASLRVDVALLSDSADNRRGMDACRDVRSLNPSVKCIILTTFEDEWTPRDVELAGASGYVLKNVQGMEIGPAILRVVER